MYQVILTKPNVYIDLPRKADGPSQGAGVSEAECHESGVGGEVASREGQALLRGPNRPREALPSHPKT